MQYRELGRTGYKVSSDQLWRLGHRQAPGGRWRTDESLAALHRAVDLGVNFFDTADVYGDGRSEQLLAKLKRQRSEPIIIATKAGRRLDPHIASGYNRENLTAFVERSLKNLEMEALDLVQLHCPPTEVYYNPEVFGVLDDLVQAGKMRYYGVSVEKVEEALKAIEYPGVQSVQIIFNIFRQRPADLFFAEAKRRQVGILARLPLSSGMLAGKMTRAAQFAPDDHRPATARGNGSTEARLSPAWILKPDWRRWRRCARSSRPAPAWRSSPCAGSWSSTRSPAPSPAPSARRRRRKISPPPTCRRSARRRCGQCGRSTSSASSHWYTTTGSSIEPTGF